jgi:hypothetical protein
MPADTYENAGGSGGRRDVKITRWMARAVRQSWPVPEHAKPAIMNRMAKLAIDPASSPREATSAAKALLDATRVNLAVVETALRVNAHEELVDRVAALEQRAAERERGPS